MNDRLGIRVDICAANPSIALANNQREVSEIFHAPTLPERDPEVSIADIACGIRSQRSQNGNRERLHLAFFNMIFSRVPETIEEIAIPRYFQELQVLPSIQPSSAPGLTNLVL